MDLTKQQGWKGLVALTTVAIVLSGASASAQITAIGSRGDSPGQFNYPSHLTLNGKGNLYVQDSKYRIQKFSSGGDFDSQITTDFEMQYSPIAFDSDSNEILAVEKVGSIQCIIHRFQAGVDLSSEVMGTACAQVMDLAVEPDGSILATVADGNGPPLLKRFSPDGALVKVFAGPEYPSGIDVGPTGDIYVSSTDGDGIAVLDAGGRLKKTMATGRKFLDVAVDPVSGKIYGTDYEHTIREYSTTGKYIGDLGGEGKRLGQFNAPYGIQADDSGHLFVADSNNNRVQKIDMDEIGPTRVLGVSINDGDLYTNDPDVELDLTGPRWATDMRVSNDGGFKGADSRGYKTTIDWKLRSSGPERLPKSVYVQYSNEDQTSGSYSDDIILDETAPVISVLEAGSASASSLRSPLAFPSGGGVRVKIRASDKTSGIARMQITGSRLKPGKWVKFRKSSLVRTAKAKIFVRVRDRAGNASRWKSVRV